MKRVVLDESRISSLSRNLKALELFPFLTMTVEGKGCCGRQAARTPDYVGIRRAIGGLSAADKLTLKTLLKADRVTSYYQVGSKLELVEF